MAEASQKHMCEYFDRVTFPTDRSNVKKVVLWDEALPHSNRNGVLVEDIAFNDVYHPLTRS